MIKEKTKDKSLLSMDLFFIHFNYMRIYKNMIKEKQKTNHLQK